MQWQPHTQPQKAPINRNLKERPTHLAIGKSKIVPSTSTSSKTYANALGVLNIVPHLTIPQEMI